MKICSPFILTSLFTFLSIFSFSVNAAVDRIYHTNFDSTLTADDPDFNRVLIKTIQEIDQYGIVDVTVNIVVQPVSNNAAFDGGKIVFIPRAMEFYNNYGADPYRKSSFDIQSVFIHEYGHAIFDAYILKNIPEYEKISRIQNQISDIHMRILNEQPSRQEITRLSAEQKRLEKQIVDDPQLYRLYMLMLPYNELFADVLAVYAMEDKSAIFQALYNPHVMDAHHSGALEELQARDFSLNHAVEGWKHNTPHSLFGPVRSFLGQDSCWPKTQEQKIQKLKHIISLISDEIKTRFHDPSDNGKNEPEQNTALLQKLAPVCL